MMFAYVLKDKRFVEFKNLISLEDVAARGNADGMPVFTTIEDVQKLAKGYRVMDPEGVYEWWFKKYIPKDIVCKSWGSANEISNFFDYYAPVNEGGEVILMSRESYKEWIRDKRARKTSKGLVFSSRYMATHYAIAAGVSNFSVHKYKDGYRVLIPIE